MPSDDVMIARLFPIVRSAYLLKSKKLGSLDRVESKSLAAFAEEVCPEIVQSWKPGKQRNQLARAAQNPFAFNKASRSSGCSARVIASSRGSSC
jgi:hypothetical protein